jgi:O-antigen ligase
MLIDSFGFGVGANAFKDRINTDESIDFLVDPHNLWIEILSQYGIVIFLAFSIAFFWVVGRLIKKALKDKKNGMMFFIAAALGFVFTFAVILPSSCLSFYPIWLFVGLMFAAHEIKPEQ